MFSNTKRSEGQVISLLAASKTQVSGFEDCARLNNLIAALDDVAEGLQP